MNGLQVRDTLVIIPAYNEEKNIPAVLADLKALNEAFDILVVNDGSKDRTAQMAVGENVYLVSHPFNLGYGAAIQTGYKYASKNGYCYLVQFDADGQHDPKDLKVILRELYKNDADLIIGSRFLGNGSLRTSSLKLAVIKMFCFLIRHLGRVRISDPTSGLKGLSKPVFNYFSGMGKYPVDFPDADILIQAVRLGFRVREVPADMRERASGKSMFSGLKPAYYIVKVLLSILIALLRHKLVNEEEYHG